MSEKWGDETIISNTRQVAHELINLPIETFLLVVDENDNEYVIDSIVKRKLHGDNDNQWCYALKLKRVDGEYIKR